MLAAQLVAVVPPLSAALTFHLLLRLLDRASLLRSIAEDYEERAIEEQERAARRRARRTAIKAGTGVNTDRALSSHEHDRADRNGHPKGATPAAANENYRSNGTPAPKAQLGELRDRIHEALAAGDRVTGDTVAQWLGVSPRTGRCRLALLIEEDPALSEVLARE